LLSVSPLGSYFGRYFSAALLALMDEARNHGNRDQEH
jgi:hypothetical protein